MEFVGFAASVFTKLFGSSQVQKCAGDMHSNSRGTIIVSHKYRRKNDPEVFQTGDAENTPVEGCIAEDT